MASEIVKKRLRDKVATRAPASNAQLVRDNFSSGTPLHRRTELTKLGELHRICLVGVLQAMATQTHHS